MSTIQSKLVVCAAVFAITLVSGFILSRSGKPYSSGIFTIHKLIAIGTIIVMVVSIRDLQQTVDMRALYPVIYAATALFFVALVVSGAVLSLVDGGILSLGSPVLRMVLTVHQIAPLLALAASAMSLYVLVSSSSSQA